MAELLHHSFLLQRLSPKPNGILHRVFGGGMTALSEEAWNLIDRVFQIEYMGAAEFEFGALPKSFRTIAVGHADYVFGQLIIGPKQIADNWSRKNNRYRRKNDPRKRTDFPKKVKQTVFYICHKDVEEAVKVRLVELAGGKTQHHEHTYFPEALDPVGDHQVKTCGWLDIEDNFFFFVNEEMAKATAELFSIGVPSESQN